MIDIRFLRQRGVTLSNQERVPPLWVIGQPRVGKSRLLSYMAKEDMKAGRGFFFGDPHEDGFHLLLKHAAILAQSDPELAERVVVINPLDEEWAPGINPLQHLTGTSLERLALLFTDLVMEIFGYSPNEAPRMSSLMMHSFAALAELGLTLIELPLFLRDHTWRNRVIRTHIKNMEVRDYFLSEFPHNNDRLRQEWMQSTTNKIIQLVWDEDMRLILGQRENSIVARKVMDESLFVLNNIAKTRLGRTSKFLGSVLVSLFRQAALSRSAPEVEARPDFYMYLDELPNWITSHTHEILSELPKFGLRLIGGHQFLDQLPPTLKMALMNTYGVIVCFRVGYQDGKVLETELYPSELDNQTRWQFQRFGRIPLLLPRREQSPMGMTKERRINELTTLGPREFMVRSRNFTQPIKQRTFDMPDIDCSPQALDALVTLSGVRYARRKKDIRHELEVDRPRLLAELAGGHPPVGIHHLFQKDVLPVYG